MNQLHVHTKFHFQPVRDLEYYYTETINILRLSMKKDIYSEDKLNIQIGIFIKNNYDLFNPSTRW